MASIGVLHRSDPLMSDSGGKWCRKWCPKKPSSQKNGISRGGRVASKKEKAIAAASAPKMEERYAGWSFFTSPPPNSLPLPAFLTKNVAAEASEN